MKVRLGHLQQRQKILSRRQEGRHNTSPIATVALGRLLTGGAMMGTMMKKMIPTL